MANPLPSNIIEDTQIFAATQCFQASWTQQTVLLPQYCWVAGWYASYSFDLHNYFWGINPLYKLCRPALESSHHCWAKVTIVVTGFILLQQWLGVAMKKLLWRCPTNREMAWSLPSVTSIMSGEMTRSRWSPIEGILISTQITSRKNQMLIIVEL